MLSTGRIACQHLKSQQIQTSILSILAHWCLCLVPIGNQQIFIPKSFELEKAFEAIQYSLFLLR